MALILHLISLMRWVYSKTRPTVSRRGFSIKGASALPLGLVLVLALAACGAGAVSTESASPTAPNPAPAGGPTDLVTETPPTLDPHDFTFNLYQGQERLGAETLRFSDLRGKPVVLNFWAGLCPPCRAEMPEFQEFYDEYQDKVVLLGIDVGQITSLGSREDAQDLLGQLGVTYPAGFTEDAAIMRNYEVFGMPTTVFVDSKGEIFRSWTGALNLKTLSRITDELLSQEASQPG